MAKTPFELDERKRTHENVKKPIRLKLKSHTDRVKRNRIFQNVRSYRNISIFLTLNIAVDRYEIIENL